MPTGSSGRRAVRAGTRRIYRSGGRRPSGVAPTVAAATPPGTPFAWYDPSDTSSITASVNVVSQINDKSGNAHHLTPVSTGCTSGLVTINGLNVLSAFTATTGQMVSGSITQAQPIIVYAVGKLMAAAPAGAQIIGNDGIAPTVFAATGVWTIYAGTVVNSVTAIDTTAHVFGATFNGASSSATLDGTSILSGVNAGASGFAAKRICLSANTAGSNWGTTSLIGEVVYYLTDPGGVPAYLKAKWGTP